MGDNDLLELPELVTVGDIDLPDFPRVGAEVGLKVLSLPFDVGLIVGEDDGLEVVLIVGKKDGLDEGLIIGEDDGLEVGLIVLPETGGTDKTGLKVGDCDGG